MKTITDKNLLDIIRQAVENDEVIDCHDTYKSFVRDLASLVCDYFGGEPVGQVRVAPGAFEIDIARNECVPGDGGIWKNYFTDVNWKYLEEG